MRYTIRIADWKHDSQALRQVRETVFIREQRVPVELEWDKHDAAGCIHLLALDSCGDPIGTARLLPDGSIGRMAVLEAWRKKGVGSSLLRCLLNEARRRGIHPVSLHAQAHAVGFYLRFGFRVSGGAFTEAGITHVKMVLNDTTG